MENKYGDEKINRYLDEIAEDYKKLLLKNMIENSNSIDELQIIDLLKVDAEIKKPLISGYKKNQRRRKLFLSAGMLYICLGIFMLIISQILNQNQIDIIPLTSITISFAGAVISIFAFIPSRYRVSSSNKTKNIKDVFEDENKFIDYIVVTKWRELEGIVESIYSKENLAIKRKSIIEVLVEYGYLNKNEEIIVKEFLKLRNQTVHTQESTFSLDKKKELINEMTNIIEKIKKYFN